MDLRRALVAITAIVAGAAIAIVAITTGGGDGEQTAVAQELPERGISVSGHGEVMIKPDTAFVDVGVSVLADSVDAARNQASEAMQKVIDAVKASGVAEQDIQTTSFSIQPEYDYSNEGTPRLIGYRVSNSVSVRIRDINAVGKIIDGAANAGGNLAVVQGVRFTIDDSAGAIAQAREKAMQDARTKAEQLAKLGAVTLGEPIAISEGGGFVPPPIFAGGFDAALERAAAPTPIQSGQLSVTVDVNVTYAIR